MVDLTNRLGTSTALSNLGARMAEQQNPAGSETVSESGTEPTDQESENELVEVYTGNTDDLEEGETRIKTLEQASAPYKCYKHKKIARFHVDKFHFSDHILFIRNEKEDDEFMTLYDGLAPVDQAAIVEFDYERAFMLESSVKKGRGVRGATATNNIKDPKAIK